jgi:SMC interacting uncharacterized protein involved in chromosome segregation
LGNLLEFSKIVPLSKTPDYVEEKTAEKRKLEEEIEKLKAEIETLQEQKEDAQLIRDDADARTTIFKLNWYTSIREDLGKYGISVDDTPKLAKLVNGLKQYEYDVNKVIKELEATLRLSSKHYTLFGKQKRRA